MSEYNGTNEVGKTNGNGNGKAKKGRPQGGTISRFIRTAGAKTVEYNGTNMTRRRALAEVYWNAALLGRLQFMDGTERRLTGREWAGLADALLDRVDGKVAQPLDVTSNSETINFVIAMRTDDGHTP